MRDKVRQIIADELGIDVSEVKDDARLITDLGADSLAVIAVISEIENEYDIDIAFDEYESVLTYTDIVNALERKLENK